MMKTRPSQFAFTLIEMLVVMAVIALLAGIILSLHGLVQRSAARSRAEGEIAAMSMACNSYKADFGSYPQDAPSPGTDPDTVQLCPLLDGDPTAAKYKSASLALYKALSGDTKPGSNPEPPAGHDDKPDGRSETKPYYEFRPNQLRKSATGEIEGIQDPFGNIYGYSTNAASAEQTYRVKVLTNANAIRAKTGGFNTTFDLWSTGGVVSQETNTALEPARKSWVKNW